MPDRLHVSFTSAGTRSACAGYLLALPVWVVVQWYCLSLDQGSNEKPLYDWLELRCELDDVQWCSAVPLFYDWSSQL